jgi:hypothetical protein
MPPRQPDPVDDLYQRPLDEFVAARNALAAQLKREGRADESAAVKSLTRPTASAWALNQVYWRARDLHDRLIAAGDRLRAQQQHALAGRAADPRETMRTRQEAVRAVVDRAAAFLEEAGNPVTDPTRQRIGVTADALATWGSQPQGYTFGRLAKDLDPPGFAALAALGGAPPLRLVKSARDAGPSREAPAAAGPAPGARGKLAATGRSVPAAPADRQAEERARREEEARRRALRAEAQDALQRLKKEVYRRETIEARAGEALAKAREKAVGIERERDELRERLAAVEERLQQAEQNRREAQAALEDAETARADAEREAAAAEQALRELT